MRGAGGGARLLGRPTSIRLGEVLAWLEDDQALVECFREGGGNCVLMGFCALRPRLERAPCVYAEMNSSTLAECVNPALRRFVDSAAPVA